MLALPSCGPVREHEATSGCFASDLFFQCLAKVSIGALVRLTLVLALHYSFCTRSGCDFTVCDTLLFWGWRVLRYLWTWSYQRTRKAYWQY